MRTRVRLVLLMVAVLILCFAVTQVMAHGNCGKEKEKEVKVTIDQVPAAVAQTLQQQAADGTIDKIEQETKKDVVTYEAEITKADGKWECKVGADGGLISMKADKDEGKDEGKEEKD